jgi:quaternary ammonium compound-resistance protein SugE
MSWLILILAGFAEVAMAFFLKASHGFSRLWQSVGFLATAILSFGLLAIATKTLPIGTAYAVWTGIGAAGTVLVGILLLGDSRDFFRLLSISLIIAGVAGLKLSSG